MRMNARVYVTDFILPTSLLAVAISRKEIITGNANVKFVTSKRLSLHLFAMFSLVRDVAFVTLFFLIYYVRLESTSRIF